MKFSIIIPAFNAEKHITRCIQSCLEQTFQNIELIIINDCSTDKTQEKIDSFSDCRIIALKNSSNLGPFASRIKGAEIASGDYVLFADSDDYFLPTTCETLFQTLQNNPVDILHFGITYKKNSSFGLNTLLHYTRYMLPDGHFGFLKTQEEIIKCFFISSYHFPRFSLCDKAFSHQSISQTIAFLNAYSQQRVLYAEDALFLFALSLFANSYLSIKNRLYVYCLNSSSTTQDPSFLQAKIQSLQNIQSILYYIRPTLVGINLEACDRFILITQAHKHIQKRHSQNYLKECLLSLRYWKRSITYLYIIIYLITFGKIKS